MRLWSADYRRLPGVQLNSIAEMLARLQTKGEGGCGRYQAASKQNPNGWFSGHDERRRRPRVAGEHRAQPPHAVVIASLRSSWRGVSDGEPGPWRQGSLSV